MKKLSMADSEEEGTRHFMVNVIEPQFNLHSEEANVSCKDYFSFRILFIFIYFYIFRMRFFSQRLLFTLIFLDLCFCYCWVNVL